MQYSKSPLFSGLTGFGTLRPAMGAIESKEEIGKRLAQTRLALGFESQVDFIKTLGGGLTLQRWNNWERGRDRIPVEWAIVRPILRQDAAIVPLAPLGASDDQKLT